MKKEVDQRKMRKGEERGREGGERLLLWRSRVERRKMRGRGGWKGVKRVIYML